MQRIYLLPTPTSPTSTQFKQFNPSASDVVVYAPVPVGRLSVEDAKGMHATEAWIPTSAKDRSHRHHHRHHSHSSSASSINSDCPRRQHRRGNSLPFSQVPYRDDTESLLEDPKEDEN